LDKCTTPRETRDKGSRVTLVRGGIWIRAILIAVKW